MLVLSRKEKESIVLSGGIVVKVHEIGPGVVKLGIEAPDHVEIWREEIALAKAAEAGNKNSPERKGEE